MDEKYIKFLTLVDELRSVNSYINAATFLDSKFERNDVLTKSFIETLSKYDLITVSNQSIWTIQKKQKLIEISDNKLKKVFNNKSLEKPKWQTFDFYMNETMKYLIGFLLGLITAYIIRK